MTRIKEKKERSQPDQLLQKTEKDQLEGVGKMTQLIKEKIFNEPIPEPWISQIEDHIEGMMKPVIQRVAQEAAMEALQSISGSYGESVGALDEPPEPVRIPGTRRENRDWERVSATIDRNLMEFFKREKKERRLSTSRLLEMIIWLHYNKPRLSYEEGDQTRAQDNAKKDS